MIAPYPQEKPNSIATMTVWSSSDPSDNVKVCLIAIKDKGHWHSEDINAGVSTTQEIWRFVSSYSLDSGLGAQDVVADTPSDNLQTYNIYGQEVSSSYRGLVISNGKKYVKQ